MFPNFEDFKSGREKIVIAGLGYVGLPLATLFGKNGFSVTGFDISKTRVDQLKEGFDQTGETSPEDILAANVEFSSDPAVINEGKLIIVTVPTPIDEKMHPDLKPIESASEIIGQNISSGSIIVFESTVYPGLTDEVCAPLIEKNSGKKRGKDFKLGYSPERISPGEKNHPLENIMKIVSGEDEETLHFLTDIYGSIIKAGIHQASSIKVAEAAKIIENIQRDLNIALMNELALIFNRLNIKTTEVIDAASTKWNFHRYEPGLVGGHCIGVDPYYMTYKAEQAGYTPQVILSGRNVNNFLGKFVGEQAIKFLTKTKEKVKDSKILILGFTFKENVKDVRNTGVFNIYRALEEFGVSPIVCDPHANKEEVKREYGVDIIENLENVSGINLIIFAVKHRELTELTFEDLRPICTENPIFMDIKGLRNEKAATEAGFTYWSL